MLGILLAAAANVRGPTGVRISIPSPNPADWGRSFEGVSRVHVSLGGQRDPSLIR